MKVCKQCKMTVEEFFSFCLNCGADAETTTVVGVEESVDAYAQTHANLEAAESLAEVEQNTTEAEQSSPDVADSVPHS